MGGGKVFHRPTTPRFGREASFEGQITYQELFNVFERRKRKVEGGGSPV